MPIVQTLSTVRHIVTTAADPRPPAEIVRSCLPFLLGEKDWSPDMQLEINQFCEWEAENRARPDRRQKLICLLDRLERLSDTQIVPNAV